MRRRRRPAHQEGGGKEVMVRCPSTPPGVHETYSLLFLKSAGKTTLTMCAAALGGAGPWHPEQHLRRHLAAPEGDRGGQRRLLHPPRSGRPRAGHCQAVGVPPHHLQGQRGWGAGTPGTGNRGGGSLRLPSFCARCGAGGCGETAGPMVGISSPIASSGLPCGIPLIFRFVSFPS